MSSFPSDPFESPEESKHPKQETVHESTMNDETTQEESKGKSKSRKTKSPSKKSWKKRLYKWGIILLIVAIIIRVAMIFALPPLLKSIAEGRGFTAAYDRLDLSILTGDLELWNFVVSRTGEDSPLLDVEYVRADVSILHLFIGKIVVRRAELDGLDVNLLIDEEGHLTATHGLPVSEKEDVEEEDEEEEVVEPTEEPTLFDLSAPIRVDAVRAQHVLVHFEDRTTQPPFVTKFETNVRVSHIGDDDRRVRFQVSNVATHVLDQIAIEGTAKLEKTGMDAEFEARMRGLHLGPLGSRLRALGISPIAESLSFDLHGKLEAHTIEERKALAASLSLSKIAVRADHDECMAIDSVQVDIERFSRESTVISNIRIEGVRGEAQRTSTGRIRVAGMELVPVVPSPEKSIEDPEPTQPSGQDSSPMQLTLKRLELGPVSATFFDQVAAQEFSVLMSAQVDALSVGVQDSPPAQIGVTISSPGLFDKMTLDATAQLGSSSQKMSAAIVVQEIAPIALKRYLDAAGIESLLEHGQFTANIEFESIKEDSGDRSIDLSIKDIEFKDTASFLSLASVTVKDLHIPEDGGPMRLADATILGLRMEAEKEREGTLRALGFRLGIEKTPLPALHSTASHDESTSTKTQESSKSDPFANGKPSNATGLAPFKIDKLTWEDNRLLFVDRSQEPALNVSIHDLGAEVTSLNLAGTSTRPGKVRLWMHVQDLLRLETEGSVTVGPSNADVKLLTRISKINLGLFKSKLEEAGIESTLDEGEIQFSTSASALMDSDSLRASLAVDDFLFKDGAEEFFAWESLSVDGVHVDKAPASGISVQSITLDGLKAKVSRDSNGALLAMGTRLPAGDRSQVTNPDQETEVEPGDSLEHALEHASSEVKQKASDETHASSANSSTISLDLFRINDARVSWDDSALGPRIQTQLITGVEVIDVVLGKPSPPCKFDIRLRVPEALDELRVTGDMTTDPNAPRVHVQLLATGLRAGPFAAYLPRGTEITLRDGHFQAAFDAEIDPAQEGGHRASIALRDVEYRDTGDEPFLALKSFKAVASRIDPKGGLFAFDELSLRGVRGSVLMNDEGVIEGFGARITPPEQPTPLQTESVDSPKNDAKAPLADTSESPEEAVIEEPSRRSKPPMISLKTLDINIDDFAVRHPTRRPIRLHDLRLWNPEPITMLGRDPDDHEAAKIQLDFGVEPLVDSFSLATQLHPFSFNPQISWKLRIKGLNGEHIPDLNPKLAEMIDGSELRNGQFQMDGEISLKIRRKDPLDFDLSKGFGFDFLLDNIAYRSEPNGDILLGLESLSIEAASIKPVTGDVHLTRIEVTNPMGRVTKTKEGMKALGLLIKTPVVEPTPQKTSTQKASEVPPVTSGRTPPKKVRPPNVIKVEKVFVSGIDFRFDDLSVTPPMNLPLEDLSIEVRGLSNQFEFDPTPIRASLSLNGGKVMFPSTDHPGQEIEGRVFDEISVRVKLASYPKLQGFVRSNVTGLNLKTFTGPAAASGVELEDGMFDSSVSMDFPESGDIEARLRTTLASLDLSEDANGPISRYLKLPTPLDTVLFILEDEGGEIGIPLDFSMAPDGLSASEMARAGTVTLITMIANAVLSSPLRVGGAVSGLNPFASDDDESDVIGETMSIAFEPGNAQVRPSLLPQLTAIRSKLQDRDDLILVLRHETGSKDKDIATLRANPNPEECMRLASRFRDRKSLLSKRRIELVTLAREAYRGQWNTRARELTEEIAFIDREIGAGENAMDQLLALTRPGAERQADRRTKEALNVVAILRMQALRDAILKWPVEGIDERIDLKRPRVDEIVHENGGAVTVTIKRRRVE